MWPDSADLLQHVLRHRGLDPSRVDSPAAAWPVFREFLAVDIDSLGPDKDSDTLAVSWGRHDWSHGMPTLAFIRRLAVDTSSLWRLSLSMVFEDRPEFAKVGELDTQSSGYYAGPVSDDVVREILWEVERYPALRALWTSAPLWSAVSFGAERLRGRDPDTFDAQQLAAYLAHRAHHG